MRLIEIKILYNADHPFFITDTRQEVHAFVHEMLYRPDVIHVSKTTILPDGEHDDS